MRNIASAALCVTEKVILSAVVAAASLVAAEIVAQRLRKKEALVRAERAKQAGGSYDSV